jgi:hypothetical protein
LFLFTYESTSFEWEGFILVLHTHLMSCDSHVINRC